ncbi:beta-galactosidase [Tautonia sp. JC769]|uniref:beta-galactosidase n=1 Tax=Tautonia sp. JC769 TaxID=3232135 RepID=UPI00345ACC89
MRLIRNAWILGLALMLPPVAIAGGDEIPNPLDDPGTFPIAVWLQAPANAEKYRSIGINTYVGLWRGPTEEQLDALDAAGMRLICGQNERSLRFRDRATIIGWMHGDEPDNAQALPGGGGYGPPIAPQAIVDQYRAIKEADPGRPVLLNLGQGVAWDGWRGRGVRTNHPEDYPEYVEGCDIASFDIYPACHEHPDVAGNLWYVPRGVERLRRWTEDRKPVWSCIETTRINNAEYSPSPGDTRVEVWMALIHGARGIIYFCHQFEPRFIEAGLLADDAMSREVAALNRQIQELAPVLHSPERPELARVSSANDDVPVAVSVREHDGATYLFAVSMRDGDTTASFTLPDAGDVRVEVLGEDRTLDAPEGTWDDRFEGYQVHLYRITPARSSPDDEAS